jgi:hypothetical protein
MRSFICRSLIAVALAASAACATHTATIADLRHNPGRYYDRTVAVEGVVRDTWNVPFAPVRAYRISDASGDVTVLSQSGRVPPRGARVEVIGRVEDVASFGNRSVGLHIRQERVHVYRD